MKKKTSTGTVARNFHEGSRSEILADYLFSGWGTVTPVRRQDDHGVDLYCTLAEQIGRLERVRDYFTVQVKSTEDPWEFNDQASVKWLVEYPIPLFLCIVNKERGLLRVYQTFPRFNVWAMGTLPNVLELKPGRGPNGQVLEWENGSSSLSAPIVEAGLPDLIDADRMEQLRKVFAHWVCLDRENCDLIRQGLLRFRMPGSYRVNELPNTGIGQIELRSPDDLKFLRRGLLRLAEAIECIGGQLGQRGDLAFALQAALLLDRIQKTHPEVFTDNPNWQHRVPGSLGRIVNEGLNKALGKSNYFYAGLDAVEKSLTSDPLVQKYLNGGK